MVFVLQVAFCIYLIVSNLVSLYISAARHGLEKKPLQLKHGFYGLIIHFGGMVLMSVNSEFNPFCWQMWILHVLVILGSLVYVHAATHKVDPEKYNVVHCAGSTIIIFTLWITAGLFWPLQTLVNM